MTPAHLARARRRGIHALEFALLMPVFLMVVVGCVEYSWLVFHQSALTSAADVGCREGSLVDPGPRESSMDQVRLTASNAMIAWFDSHGPGCGGDCTTLVEAVGERPSRSLRCSISTEYKTITRLIPAPEIVRGSAVIRLEYQRSSE